MYLYRLKIVFSQVNLIYMNNNLVKRGEPYKDKNKWIVLQIQYYIGAILNKFPRLKKVVVELFDYITISIYQKKSKKLLKNKDINFDYNKTYWLDPKRIRYVSLKEFFIDKYRGEIIGGDWDLLEKSFEDLDLYVAFKERFIEGKKWETTVFYSRTLNEIKQGIIHYSCKNKNDLDNRFRRDEMLYETIKNNGYKSQQELQSKNKYSSILVEDEIAVNIGRNGDFLFNNGSHRLAIAKLLNIPKIPVKITVRHPQWVNSNKKILLYDDSNPPQEIY